MKTMVAAAVGALLLASSCSGGSGADGRTTPDTRGSHAPGELLLRKKKVGGIAGLGGPGTPPDVSIYTDGVAIARDGPRLTRYRLTPRAVARLGSQARAAGLSTPRTVDDPHVADAMYAVITYVADGTPHTTKVIQSGEPGDRAAAFADRLDPKGWSRHDQVASPTPYEPLRVAALAVPSHGDAPAPWPFGPLGSGVKVGTQSCTTLTGRNAEKAGRLPGGRLWTHDLKVYRVTVRPLLPDESGCADLTR